MKVEVKDKELIITLPLFNPPRPSSTGKTLVVAGTGGFQASTAVLNGKPISISVNAVVKP